MFHDKAMATSQQFCLRWNNHQSTLISVFDHLLESGTLVDCTLAAEGQFLKAHKVVLSACSPYLEALLSQHYEKHPILILKDVTFQELKSMLDYMYRGEVNISQEQLGTFLKAAESLQIKGLTENGAIHENKDLERARELEHLRELQNVGLDRSLGIPILPKRMETVRKHIPIVPRARSPLVGLPSNYIMNSDQQKNNKSEINASSPVNSRSREGSASPTARRKRVRHTNNARMEENKPNQLSKLLENNHVENHVEKRKEQVSQNSANSVPLNHIPADEKKVNNSVHENENNVCAVPVPVKCEVKTECADFTDEVQNDDSVGDMTIDDEEEEMEEMDLSRPGPSSSANSTVAGIPWHMVGEGNGGEEMLLAQSDNQGGRKYLSTLVPNWESWSAMHPSVPNFLRGALGAHPAQAGEEPKGVECGKCGRHYKLKSSLRNHQKWECGKEPQFQCPYCNYRAKQKMHVARHIERMHREKLEMLEIHDRVVKDDASCYQQEAMFQQDAA